jgi:hypothetical protein
MDIDSLTIGNAKKIAAMLGSAIDSEAKSDHPWVGRYVIVRCRDAGVHAGELVSASGRTCMLTKARRLWYWKPSNGATFLSGVAAEGLDASSKVGTAVDIELTENCEIIACSDKAAQSIANAPDHKT